MTGRSATRAIRTFYAYRALTAPGFLWPVYVVFLVDHGVSFTALALGGAAKAVVIVLGEVPTGYVGDRIGRRNSIVVSQTLFATWAVALIWVRSALGAALVFGLLGLAETFQSGSVSAWLYDTLDEHDRTETFTRVQGRGTAIRLWVTAATMVAGGALYVVHPAIPFVATGLTAVGAFAVALSLPKNAQFTRDDHVTPSPREMAGSVRDRLASPELRGVVVLTALFFAAVQAADPYVQPIGRDALEPLLAGVAVGGAPLPETVGLGALYAAFTVVGAVVSDHAAALENRLGTGPAMGALVAGTGAFMLLPAFAPVLALPMVFALRSGGRLFGPIRTNYVNGHTSSESRATVLSATRLVGGVARVPLMLVAGVVADAVSPLLAVAVLGALLLGGSGLTALLARPVTVPATTSATAE